MRHPLHRAAAALILLLPVAARAQSPAPGPADSSSLAHLVLEAGLAANALGGDLKPWHIKVDFRILEPGMTGPVSGTMEEWRLSRYRWKRVYSSAHAAFNGSEWGESRTARYRQSPSGASFAHALLDRQVADPALDPLAAAAALHPGDTLEMKHATTNGLSLNCVALPDTVRPASQPIAAPPIPSLCFEQNLHLRLTVTPDAAVQMEDIQPFDGRTVASSIKVIEQGKLRAELKVVLLEPIAGNAPDLRPPPQAVAEPYELEPGSPLPESVFEIAADLPANPGAPPYKGESIVPVLIHANGSVTVRHDAGFSASSPLFSALEHAVQQWRFKPYLVDGNPTDVATRIRYDLSAAPFVPSYVRRDQARALAAASSRQYDFAGDYDPHRDPLKDLAEAEADAARTHRRILVEVGGQWCGWCKILDRFFASHAATRQLLDANYILLKVNKSPENENPAFLSRFGEIPGYPFLYVLDAQGNLVHAQRANALENDTGDNYSDPEVRRFLTAWRAL